MRGYDAYRVCALCLLFTATPPFEYGRNQYEAPAALI